jgi:hypothetical protein
MTEILVDIQQENVDIPVDIKKAQGTFNYKELDNKPSINGIELDGNKTTADLGISLDTSMYPTREELSEYIKNTDYASTDKGGVIKQSTTYGFSVNSNTGVPLMSSFTSCAHFSSIVFRSTQTKRPLLSAQYR